MELRGIRSLLMLSEQGSFIRAAAQLHISPPAVHKQLKLLEAELGVQVYSRVGNRLTLTEAGKTLLPHFRALLSNYGAALTSIKELQDIHSGSVRISGGLSLTNDLLPRFLKAYRRLHPQVDLYVESGNFPAVLAGLHQGTLDVAFLGSVDLLPKEDDSISVEVTWPYDFVFVGPPRMGNIRCSIHELKKHPFIHYPSGGFEHVDGYFSDLDFHPRIIMRLDSADAMQSMVQAGMGISMLPMWSVQRALRSGRLSIIETREAPLRSSVGLVRRKDGYASQAVQAMIRLARETNFGNLDIRSKRRPSVKARVR